MKTAAPSRRDRIRSQLADLKMPGALESLDQVLSQVDGAKLGAAEAIESLLGAQIESAPCGEDAHRLRLQLPALDQAGAA